MNILPKSKFFFDWYGIEGMKHFVISDDKKSSPKNIKNDRKNWSESQKADTLQTKIFNECLQETKGKQNQKFFRRCSTPLLFNT